jgi:hypothetical protein
MPASLGKYYDQVALGRVFIGNTAAAGVALPVETGTAVTFGLWNTSTNMKRRPALDLDCLRLRHHHGVAALSSSTSIAASLSPRRPRCLPSPTERRRTRCSATAAHRRCGSPDRRPRSRPAARAATLGLDARNRDRRPRRVPGGHDFDGRLIVPPGHLIFPASPSRRPACSAWAWRGLRSRSKEGQSHGSGRPRARFCMTGLKTSSCSSPASATANDETAAIKVHMADLTPVPSRSR